jgi:hypothetical protein
VGHHHCFLDKDRFHECSALVSRAARCLRHVVGPVVGRHLVGKSDLALDARMGEEAGLVEDEVGGYDGYSEDVPLEQKGLVTGTVVGDVC